MADVIHGNTQIGASKMDLITAIALRELQFMAKLAPTVTDYSSFAIKGAKSVKIPKLGSFSVTNRASGVAGDASVLSPNAAVDTIDLDWNAYIAYIVDSSDEIQSTVEWQSELARRAAGAHGRYVDTQIIAVLEAAGVATTTAGAFTYDIAREMRQAYITNDGDLSQAVFLLGPDQESNALDQDEFKRAEVFGQAVIPSGIIGRILGIPVMVHNGVAASTFYLYGKEAVGLAFQKGPQVSEQQANEYGSGAMRVAMDQLFGVDALYKGLKGVLATQSPLIIKDNN